jgi:hypothetical protein
MSLADGHLWSQADNYNGVHSKARDWRNGIPSRVKYTLRRCVWPLRYRSVRCLLIAPLRDYGAFTVPISAIRSGL